MLKRGFFTIEILLAMLLFFVAAYILFGYIAQIQKQRHQAEIIYIVTNLASESLERRKAVQSDGFQTVLENTPAPYRLKKLKAMSKHMQTGLEVNIWTIK